eukprot:gnl/Chilomastix_caulleri/1743.p1 GENE.gnl/Chilomastix_caulleri/1743~~gnl/Chilomastix_caulleri/1743.p1  ORF type:complete len:162 (+),score=21.59 gnl/Chilomastix_caulleri/1743:117-602(+)
MVNDNGYEFFDTENGRLITLIYGGRKAPSNYAVSWNIKVIGNYAAYYIDYITNVELHSDVTEIGAYAFAYMGSLDWFEIVNGPMSMKESVFDNDGSLRHLNIPKSLWTGDLHYNSLSGSGISSVCLGSVEEGDCDGYVGSNRTVGGKSRVTVSCSSQCQIY